MSSQAPSPITAIVGTNLRRARLDAGLTQREVANALDSEHSLVSKWERGRHQPDQRHLRELCRLFGVEHAWLFTNHSNHSGAAA